MSTAQRAHVQVVTDGPTVPPPPPPDDDLGPELASPPIRERAGGEQMAEVLDGGLAAKLRARYEQTKTKEREFGIPGWWNEDERRYDLVLVARAFRDRKRYEAGVRKEAFIAKCTARLVYVEDDGTRREIAGGWGEELARMIGVDLSHSRTPASDLVALVCDNPVRVDALAAQLLEWMGGLGQEAEQELGE